MLNQPNGAKIFQVEPNDGAHGVGYTPQVVAGPGGTPLRQAMTHYVIHQRRAKATQSSMRQVDNPVRLNYGTGLGLPVSMADSSHMAVHVCQSSTDQLNFLREYST
jgi:hypothetical protein